MKVHFAYGRSGLEVELPDHTVVLRPTHVPPLPDGYDAVVQSLRKPLGCAPLSQKVSAQDTVAIVFSDITRPTPNHIIIPAILAELTEAGVPRENITLINGLGMHRPNTQPELEELLGKEVVEGYRIIQHDSEDSANLIYLLKNKRGTDVYISSYYLNASIRILTGFVEPHVFAGWSGGGKCVLPAVAGAEAIMSNHSGPMLAHPASTWCRTADNPIFAEMREVALATDPTFTVNVTINERKELTSVFSGELVLSHDATIAFAERVYVQDVPQEFDIAVAGHIGHPADLNLYQSVKGLSVAAQAVREGGSVILCAECGDGLGLKDYADLMGARATPQELLELIEDPSFRAHDQWGVQLTAMALVKVEGYLFSTISAEDAARAHMRAVQDVGVAVTELSLQYRRNGDEPRILALPFGQFTVPRLAATPA